MTLIASSVSVRRALSLAVVAVLSAETLLQTSALAHDGAGPLAGSAGRRARSPAHPRP